MSSITPTVNGESIDPVGKADASYAAYLAAETARITSAPATAPAQTAQAAPTAPAAPAPATRLPFPPAVVAGMGDQGQPAQSDQDRANAAAAQAKLDALNDAFRRGSVTYNSAEDHYEINPSPPLSGSQHTAPTELPDDGRDLYSEANKINSDYKKLEDRWNAVTYDKVTGKATPAVQGRDRDVLAQQLKQARDSGAFQIHRLNMLIAQRQRQSAEVRAADGNSVAAQAALDRLAYIDSAPPGQRKAYADRFDYSEELQAKWRGRGRL